MPRLIDWKKTGGFLKLGILLLICGIFFFSCTTHENNPEKGKWLLLFYDDAEFIGYDALYDFANEAYAHDNLDILVLQDSMAGPAIIWRIGSNHERTAMKILGEVNMADDSTLREFLSYAEQEFPGRRKILSFYDHGSGCFGSCVDMSNDNTDILTMQEIRGAILNNGKLDLLMFSGPGLMGNIEAAYEVNDITDVYIGSENLSGYTWWFHTMDYICATLKVNPGISAIDFGRGIVNSLIEQSRRNHPQDFHEAFTMCAVNTAEMKMIKYFIDELGLQLSTIKPQIYSFINSILGQVQSYDNSFRDAVHFCELVAGQCQNESIRKSALQVIVQLQRSVIAEGHGDQVADSHGLSLFFPKYTSRNTPYIRYTDAGLTFAKGNWKNFLDEYFWNSFEVASTPTRQRTAIRVYGDGLSIPKIGLLPPIEE